MKKLVSLLLMLVFVFSLSCAMAEGKKHVENLIVGTTAANNTFNMTTQSDAFGRMNYNGLTQGNYVYRDANGDLQPYFFTSYEISEDGKVLDFTWHKGAIWHDGQPVTDEDIIFTFEFQRDVKKVGGLSNLVSVEITGENAARLTFSQPDVYYYLNTSCMNTACIYAKHIWEGIEDYSHYTGEDAAIGCGRTKLVGYDVDSQTSYYEAVPENAFLGEITVDKVTVQTYADQASLMMALASGECDAYYNYANPIEATLIDSFTGMDGLDMAKARSLAAIRCCSDAAAHRATTGISVRRLPTPSTTRPRRPPSTANTASLPTAACLVRPSRALTIPSRCWSTTRRPRNPCWMRRAMSMRTATAGANCRTAARWICPSFRSIPAAWKSAPVWAKSSASPSRMSA